MWFMGAETPLTVHTEGHSSDGMSVRQRPPVFWLPHVPQSLGGEGGGFAGGE
jgi:hypothetical protein